GDDDGRVDMAAFLFREIDAACGGPGIWPHRSRLAAGVPAAATNDKRPNGSFVVVDDYITLGARDCSGTQALEVNVFAHETGHVLGLPDYYDSSSGILRQQRRWVVGCWEIMSAGSWGCGSGPQPSAMLPPHFGAYTKMLFGWITPQIITTVGLKPQEITLHPANSTGDAVRINLSFNEYLFVEYRKQQGFDAGLPASGILVYHVETGRAFLPCPTCPRTWSYRTVEADGDSALVRQELEGGNRGAAGDAWGVSRTVLDDTTIPSTKLNTGVSSFVRLSRMVIDAAQGVARVTISLVPSNLTIERLVAGLGMNPVTPVDRIRLDAAGNGNDRYDVGDFRAYLKIRSAD
ncbi:MAG TPA: immune inhibitor A domain-containing protein, partial [Gemmatimonadaceae bacterium]